MPERYPLNAGDSVFFSLVPRGERYAALPLEGMDGEPPCPVGWQWEGGDAHFWATRDYWMDAFGSLSAFGPEDMLARDYADDVELANPIRRMPDGSAQCLGCYAVRSPDGAFSAWADIRPSELHESESPPEIRDSVLPGWRSCVDLVYSKSLELDDDALTAAIRAEAGRLGLNDDLSGGGDTDYDPRAFVEWEPGGLAWRGI